MFTDSHNKAEEFFTNIYHNRRLEIDYYRNSREIQEIRLLMAHYINGSGQIIIPGHIDVTRHI